jgi:hypothetical protein
VAPKRPVYAVTTSALILLESLQLIITYTDHMISQTSTRSSPILNSKFTRVLIEPLQTIKIAPKQDMNIPSQPEEERRSPIKKKARIEVTDGPILSIIAAFEAGVKRRPSNRSEL